MIGRSCTPGKESSSFTLAPVVSRISRTTVPPCARKMLPMLPPHDPWATRGSHLADHRAASIRRAADTKQHHRLVSIVVMRPLGWLVELGGILINTRDQIQRHYWHNFVAPFHSRAIASYPPAEPPSYKHLPLSNNADFLRKCVVSDGGSPHPSTCGRPIDIRAQVTSVGVNQRL